MIIVESIEKIAEPILQSFGFDYRSAVWTAGGEIHIGKDNQYFGFIQKNSYDFVSPFGANYIPPILTALISEVERKLNTELRIILKPVTLQRNYCDFFHSDYHSTKEGTWTSDKHHCNKCGREWRTSFD